MQVSVPDTPDVGLSVPSYHIPRWIFRLVLRNPLRIDIPPFRAYDAGFLCLVLSSAVMGCRGCSPSRLKPKFGRRVNVRFDDGEFYWGTINNNGCDADNPQGRWSVLFDDNTLTQFADGDPDGESCANRS